MKNHIPLFATTLLAAVAANSSSAIDIGKGIQVGGFASQGYLVNSGDNDYFGDSSEGTSDFREYAVNASWSHGAWRVGAQAFGQKLGIYGEDKITLDWGIVDYQPAQWFGLRAGRVKMPRGLYNEALDVDSVRPFVLMPQSVYDARLRDFNSAFNGALVYGNVSAGQYGSVDYRLFYGKMSLSTDSGANDYFNNDAPYANSRFEMDAVYGGSVFWNTPINGLRVGYSYSGFVDFGADRIVPGVPLNVYRDTDIFHRHLLSAEYVVGDWTFAAELGRETAHFDIALVGNKPEFGQEVKNTYGYVSAARRINTWLELGGYCSYSKDVNDFNHPTIKIPDSTQTDYALSAKFDITERLICKVEGHYIDGAGKLFDTATEPQPIATRDTSWFVLAAKVTVSF